ncbi:MAG: DUF6600 domain-containing protein [Pseudolabrys sp.]|jgi:hypothetical protein
MASFRRIRRAVFAITTGAAIAIGLLLGPIVTGTLAPAQAQISEDAQIALEQYGMWRPHPRFGDVWVPAGIPPDWRPYQYGHWVYTDEWGWYWVSDDVEANWGWVVYHYGRWAFERGFGWFWVPGDEWAPAWVNWRYGDEYVGWAPLPPDELVGAYEVEPAYWAFVPGRYLAAPRLRTYFVPVYRRSVILRTTNIVNRTVQVHGARLAVNPGIPPAFVARVSGAPVATYHVRPRVFASTQGVSGAVQVRRDELRGPGPGGPAGPGRPGRPGIAPPPRLPPVSIQRTTTVVQPSATVTAPQPLGKNEAGRLGTNPPRAAQGTAPPSSTTPPPSTPPASTPPGQREERRDRVAPGGPPPQQPSIVRPTPPQASPPAPPSPPPGATPPQQRQVQPPQPSAGQQPERRERLAPGGPPGGPPPPQPNIVRPTPPQASPPPGPPPPQQRQVQPPQPPGPPPPQQQRVQPPPAPPPPQQRVQPPPGPPPQGARGPGQPPPGPPPKKPPPKPGEEEKK